MSKAWPGRRTHIGSQADWLLLRVNCHCEESFAALEDKLCDEAISISIAAKTRLLRRFTPRNDYEVN
jgi:hypothetical protein